MWRTASTAKLALVSAARSASASSWWLVSTPTQCTRHYAPATEQHTHTAHTSKAVVSLKVLPLRCRRIRRSVCCPIICVRSDDARCGAAAARSRISIRRDQNIPSMWIGTLSGRLAVVWFALCGPWELRWLSDFAADAESCALFVREYARRVFEVGVCVCVCASNKGKSC